MVAEIVDVDFVFGDVEAELTGFAIGPGLGATTGHEGGEGLRVVIAAGVTTKGGVGFTMGVRPDSRPR